MNRASSPAKRKTVLLVDDETLWLDAVRSAVMGGPFSVITAPGAEEALKRLHDSLHNLEGRPDLILSDVRMPAMNGFDLFDRVRSDPGLKTIPYVFMSSIDDFDAKSTAKAIGADGYVEKPYDVEQVKTILTGLLDRFYDH